MTPRACVQMGPPCPRNGHGSSSSSAEKGKSQDRILHQKAHACSEGPAKYRKRREGRIWGWMGDVRGSVLRLLAQESRGRAMWRTYSTFYFFFVCSLFQEENT